MDLKLGLNVFSHYSFEKFKKKKKRKSKRRYRDLESNKFENREKSRKID